MRAMSGTSWNLGEECCGIAADLFLFGVLVAGYTITGCTGGKFVVESIAQQP
jgi:hypothetical protein